MPCKEQDRSNALNAAKIDELTVQGANIMIPDKCALSES